MNDREQGLKGAFAAHPSLARRVAAKRFLARLVLVAEQALPMMVPVLGIAAVFAALSWFGLFRLMPDGLRWVTLFAFVFSFLLSLLPLGRVRWPKAAEADRLLEERNHLRHQPVGVQGDTPAFDTPFARALWQEHQNRMAEKIATLDAGLPRPDIARHDRFALRTIPALLVVTAFGYSMSGDAGALTDAFRTHENHATSPDLRIDAWITPPAYTGLPPIYLADNDAALAAPISVPRLSDLTVRITGGHGGEKVTFLPAGKTQAMELGDGPDGVPAADMPDDAKPASLSPAARNHVLKLEEGGTLSVDGRKMTFAVIPDKPPEIAFDGIPRRSVNGALEIGFTVKDDYGVEEAHAKIEPIEANPDAKPLYPLPEYPLDIPRRRARDAKGLASKDLTEHPLAGKRVRITLVARDAIGQTGRSPPHEMVLPSRNFQEPLAAAVAEERQIFSLDRRDMPNAIALNEALTLRADETIPNLTHYLLIESALARMKLAGSEEALKDTAAHLWEIALGIEDGDLSLAARKLRDAQQALADALARNAPDAEIQKRMDDLRKAMQEYLSAMAERMQNNKGANPNLTAKNILRQQDLQRMMDQIENLARSGNRDAARQMLSDLQRLMNNLQAGRRPQQGQGQENSKMRQQIDKLGELLQEQQALMEKTFRLDQMLRDRMLNGDPDTGEDGELLQRPPGESGQSQGSPADRMTTEQLREALKQLRAQQDGLGKKLEELNKGLAELGMKPGEGFGEAGREMKGAGEALGEAEGDRAVAGQGKALEALRKGAGEMMNQMMQAMQGQGQQGQANGTGRDGRDPLGRPRDYGGAGMDAEQKIPDVIDVQRAREILDAIRRKLGGDGGPEIERRYLERLLDIR